MDKEKLSQIGEHMSIDACSLTLSTSENTLFMEDDWFTVTNNLSGKEVYSGNDWDAAWLEFSK